MSGMNWTKKMVKSVTFLFNKDLSALKAAHEMNKMYGDWLPSGYRFTRNSVIGKWNRLGLHKQKIFAKAAAGAHDAPNPGFNYKKASVVDSRRNRIGRGTFKDIEVDAYDMATDAITFNEIEDKSCRWPITTGGFCGRPKAKKLYCLHHHDRAYQKAK